MFVLAYQSEPAIYLGVAVQKLTEEISRKIWTTKKYEKGPEVSLTQL